MKPAIRASLLAIICLITISSDAADRKATVIAAARVGGLITAAQAKIGICRQVDARNAEHFDEALVVYQRRNQAIMAKVYAILTEEAHRAGLAPDSYTKYLVDAAGMARQEATRLQTVDPGAFLNQCHNILETAPMGFAGLSTVEEELPDEMRLLREWR